MLFTGLFKQHHTTKYIKYNYKLQAHDVLKPIIIQFIIYDMMLDEFDVLFGRSVGQYVKCQAVSVSCMFEHSQVPRPSEVSVSQCHSVTVSQCHSHSVTVSQCHSD